MKRNMRRIGLVALLLGLGTAYGLYDYLTGPRTIQRGDWTVLTGCAWLPHGANDGDSFRVMHRGEEYIFRIYYVDAPETADYIPGRVDDQMAYFGTTREQTLALGHAATELATRELAGPFTVITRFRDAMGSSSQPRYFAFVETAAGEDLGLLLVARGLGRIHGVGVERGIEVPVETKDHNHYRHALYAARNQAREQRLGGWAYASGAASPDDGEEASP